MRGNRSDESLRNLQLGQLKERAGFFVSRSLTLPSAPLWAMALFDDYPGHLKKKVLHVHNHVLLELNEFQVN